MLSVQHHGRPVGAYRRGRPAAASRRCTTRSTANIEEADPIAAYTKHVRNIVHIHISENDRGVPGRGNIPWAETFAAIRKSGYDDWLTIESFGRGLKDLAAATKVWRDFAESPEAVYRDGYKHIRNGWKKAAAAARALSMTEAATMAALDIGRLVSAVADTIAAHADELTALDQAIGDGDHGLNMKRGFEAVRGDLAAIAAKPLPDALKAIGTKLVMTVGGASGPLFGTFFLTLGKELPPEPDRAALAAAFAKAVDAVAARGKSQAGQKTMLDVLYPVAAALAAGKPAARSWRLPMTRPLRPSR